jgi:hypothetical protein
MDVFSISIKEKIVKKKKKIKENGRKNYWNKSSYSN